MDSLPKHDGEAVSAAYAQENEALTIDLTTIANTHDNDLNRLVFNGTYKSMVADAIFPKLSQLRPTQCFTDGTWVVDNSKTIMKKIENAPCYLWIALLEVLAGKV